MSFLFVKFCSIDCTLRDERADCDEEIVIRRGKENVVANNSWKPMVAARNKLMIRIRAVRRRYCVGGGGTAAAHGSSSDCFRLLNPSNRSVGLLRSAVRYCFLYSSTLYKQSLGSFMIIN